MADAGTLEFFQKQREVDVQNGICCDCGTRDPEWASVSHGIYLSIEASGVHRSLGVRMSYVQSTCMDSWKPLHLRMMELGGNQRFVTCMREHGVPEDMTIRQKYSTRAAEWYRANLRAMAEDITPPPALPPGIGHLPAEGATSSTPEQLILDQVFAKTPLQNDVSVGGVHAGVSGRPQRPLGVHSISIFAPRAPKRARPSHGSACSDASFGAPVGVAADPGAMGEAITLPRFLGRCGSLAVMPASENDSLGVWKLPSPRPIGVLKQLVWTTRGDRTAERAHPP